MNRTQILKSLAGTLALALLAGGCKSSPYQYTTAPSPAVSGWDYAPQAGTLCATVNVLGDSYVYGQMSDSGTPNGHYNYANNVVSFAYNVWDTISQNDTYAYTQDAGTNVNIPWGQLYPFYVYYNSSYPYTLVNPTFYGPLTYRTSYRSANGTYLNSPNIYDQISDTLGNGEGQCGFAYTYVLSTSGPRSILDTGLRMASTPAPTHWEEIKQLTMASADTSVKVVKFDVRSAIIGNPKFKYGGSPVSQEQFNKSAEARKFVYLHASNELKLLSQAIAEAVKKTAREVLSDESIREKASQLRASQQGLSYQDSLAQASILVGLEHQQSVLAESTAFQNSLNEISALVKQNKH